MFLSGISCSCIRDVIKSHLPELPLTVWVPHRYTPSFLYVLALDGLEEAIQKTRSEEA